MAMFLKIDHGLGDGTYSIYAEIVSCHFNKQNPQEPMAHVWVREPVKTLEVPGYCEVEKHIVITGDAFLMNEQGRTISKFLLNVSADPKGNPDPA